MREEKSYFSMANMSNRKFITIANYKFILTIIIRFRREVALFSSNITSGSAISVPWLVRD